MVTQMESRIKEITNELIDQVAAKGEMDAIRDLAGGPGISGAP